MKFDEEAGMADTEVHCPPAGAGSLSDRNKSKKGKPQVLEVLRTRKDTATATEHNIFKLEANAMCKRSTERWVQK